MYFSFNIIRVTEWNDVEIGRGNAAHIGLGICAVSVGKCEERTDRMTILLKRIL